MDADHINLDTVDGLPRRLRFLHHRCRRSAIGRPVEPGDIDAFLGTPPRTCRRASRFPAWTRRSRCRAKRPSAIAAKYLYAVQEAGRIYRHIARAKGAGNFVTEVSMDETDSPQTPPELLVILAALADERIPAQTIAPKFTGRFNKGVDYVGDVASSSGSSTSDLAVIAYAATPTACPPI